MKYLKEYDDIVGKYEELSEYLQELFDKFGISFGYDRENIYWEILKSPEGARYGKQSSILINNIFSRKLVGIIFKEILRIQKTIEYRIGQKIEIVTKNMSIHIILV